MILPKNADKSVPVIDKHSDIAGNVYTEEIERNNVHVYGAHILHINEDSFKPEAWEKVSNAVKLLKDAGARVILQPKVYQRYAVIDKSTVWYGGINFLGFEKTAHGAMRLCSAELAKELLDRSRAGEETQIKLAKV